MSPCQVACGPDASIPGVRMGTVGHGRRETGDHQPDPHGAIERFGGSFPSGHVIIVCSNLAVLLPPGVGRWIWHRSFSLVEETQWTTDIVGGALRVACVLAAASASGWVQRSKGRPGNDLEQSGALLPGTEL